jgi:Na+-transporting NADH:ubiquinone oxidoreductase subunit B
MSAKASGGSPAKKKPKKLLMKQPQMLRMIYALIPILLTGIYFFGWVVLGIVLFSAAVGFAVEYVSARHRGQPVSTALFVTILLYALSLPATTPLWVAGVGAAVAVLFGKEVYGGFGRNWVNPAIVGRAFVYICFPQDLTGRFVPAFQGFPGGFAHWSFTSLRQLPEYLRAGGENVADAVTQASPMFVGAKYGSEAIVNDGQGATLVDMALGTIGGIFQTPGGERDILAAGSIGEGCGVIIVLCAIYLLVTKTASWRLMLGGLLGVVAASLLFRQGLGYTDVGQVPPLAWQVLSGTTLYAMVFMVTEPVSAPRKNASRLIYAFVIGFLLVFLRWKGPFVAAATFSILLGNMLAPLIEQGVTSWEDWRKAKAPAKEGEQ